ncbi:hypothetical protein WJX82_007894 [Trebouxia sp. C0006]
MMKSVACLRPAACSQQLASFSVLKEPAKTYTSRVALICRPASSGLLPALKCHLPRSSGRKVSLTVTAASRISARQVYHRQSRDESAWPEPRARSGFQIPWQTILRVLLLVPVFILPAFLPSFPRPAHAARASAPTRTVEVWPANHGPIRQATTVSEGSEHHFSPASWSAASFSSASPADTSPVVVDHSNFHSNIRGGFVDDTPRGHSSPVAEIQQTFAESPSTRVAVFVSCGVALLFLLRTTHLRRAAASNDRQMQNWREQDAGVLEPNASPAFAAAAVGAAGRVLPVEERQAKAKEDIAAAKARQAAFAGQGSLQFTDVDIAKPDPPDISSDSESSLSSATATMALDDAQMPSPSQLPDSGTSQPSSQPTQGSATGTFVLDKDVSAADAIKKFKAEQSAAEQPPAESDGGRPDTGKPAPVYEPDTSKPLYTQGRADLKPPSRSPSQTSPLQAQQATSFTPSAPSSASSFAPSQQEVQNPLQGLLSVFQGLLGGQSTSTATPSTSSSGSSGVGAEQARPVPLTAAQQAQLSPADASASQRMAASNQALAAGKGQPRTRREVPVKRYTEVNLPGDVTEFVQARGLRAPLVLLAGLAASAAQTLEPLWSADSRGRKRQAYSDDEPLDWNRYRKYDVFNDLLGAAAASPAAQGEEFSPFRTLANAVPQEGVPKYDFLRNILQGALSSPASAPDTGLVQGLLRGPQRVTGPDGKAVRSKYDPFHALLQRAQEDPSWPSEGPGFDPLASAFQDASEPWYPLITKYDPFQALFNAQDPTGSSAPGLDPLGGLLQQARQRKPPTKAFKVKLDPFQSLFKDSGPSKETFPLDPVGNLLENVRQPRQPSVDSKYDVFQALFNAEGPGSEASTLDPLGNLLQSMRQAKLRSADSNKYDAFQDLFRAEGPTSETSTLDPLGNLLQSVRQAKLRSPDSMGNLLQNVSQPRHTPVKSKYDPFQAIFNAPGPSEQAPALDPLGALLEGARKPWTSVTSKKGAGPGAAITRLDKYDLVYQILSSQPASGAVPGFDPVGSLLKSSWLKEPSTQQKQLATDMSNAGFAQTRDRGFVSQQAAAPSQAGRALGNEHEARQQAQADFMRRGRQPAAASGFEGQGEGPEEADRPSEWAGFVYNPYSGDLLPPEDDDDDEGESQDVGVQGGSDMGVAYKGQRSGVGGGAGSGKPQFVSANAFRGPSSRRPTQTRLPPHVQGQSQMEMR